ncbi:ArsR/SmtB family transcription factor [Amorphus sp. 3PC139-8]|uniref:ArsR/SmtB family transcription factor n=1 Tax=Amorphus sp. 3PC139-8 TaxID=2735676 RepID=UPI00345DCD6F
MQTTLESVLAERAEEVAALLAALANQKRLLVLCHLLEGERSVTVLAEDVGLSQSAMSQHLAKMRALGLVAGRRDAQTVYYSIASDDLRQLMHHLAEIYCEPYLSAKQPGGPSQR